MLGPVHRKGTLRRCAQDLVDGAKEQRKKYQFSQRHSPVSGRLTSSSPTREGCAEGRVGTQGPCQSEVAGSPVEAALTPCHVTWATSVSERVVRRVQVTVRLSAPKAGGTQRCCPQGIRGAIPPQGNCV